MGYVQDKYTRAYFLKQDTSGNSTIYGAEGIEYFKKGKVRPIDDDILGRLTFQGKTVLDLGFGRGEAIKHSLERGAVRAVGVDFSEAAYDIAKEYLKGTASKVELHCDDALAFVKAYSLKSDAPRFDIVLMLDFIEHVPRHEVAELLVDLLNVLSDRGIVVINTPIFNVDNDIISDGLKSRAKDTSDRFVETSGMHCNRYTRKSLKLFMRKCGYTALSGHFFIPEILDKPLLAGDSWLWRKACSTGYPIQLAAIRKPELFEYQSTLQGILDFRRAVSKLFGLAGTAAGKLIQCIGFLELKVENLYRKTRQKLVDSRPQVIRVNSGPLRGYHLLLSLNSPAPWHREMMEGTYEPLFLAEVNKLSEEIRGKIVWDVGAHIGYHTLVFAELVGEKGHVVAFEPNQYNVERLRKNLEINAELQGRITLIDAALSNTDGEQTFITDFEIDNGRSSGSHLSNAVLPEQPIAYRSFSSTRVNTLKADTLLTRNENLAPYLIKIDVEGAENLVLGGATNLLLKFKPVLLIEIHNIVMMFHVQKLLSDYGYDIKILDEENCSLSRCFIVARCKN